MGAMPENSNRKKGIDSGCDIKEPENKEMIESGRKAREPESKQRDRI